MSVDHPHSSSAVERLRKKLPTAAESAKDAKEAFQLISNTADPAKVLEWGLQEEKAQADRNSNPEAMDIYDVKTTSGVSI